MLIGGAKPPDPLLAPALEPAQNQDRKFSIKWTLRAGNSVGTDRIAFLIGNC